MTLLSTAAVVQVVQPLFEAPDIKNSFTGFLNFEVCIPQLHPWL